VPDKEKKDQYVISTKGGCRRDDVMVLTEIYHRNKQTEKNRINRQVVESQESKSTM